MDEYVKIIKMLNLTRNLVGLDIGASTIKIVELAYNDSKGIKLLSAGIVDNPTHEWEDKGIPEATEALAKSIKGACRQFNIKNKAVAIALGTTEVIFDYLKFPPLNEKELANAVKFEAEQLISSNIEQVSIDYKRLSADNKDGKENILLVAVPKEITQKKIEVVAQAGLNPMVMDVEPLALLNCLIPLTEEPMDKNESVGILNIGAGITNLSILSSENFPTIRNINFGGDRFSAFIRKETGLSFDEVEKLKKDPNKLRQKGINIEQMLEKQTIAFINEIKSSIEYTHRRSDKSAAGQQNRRATDPHIKKIFLTGGGSLIEGLDKFLSKNLGVEIARWNPFEKVAFSRYLDGSLKPMGYFFPVSIGLGMRTI